MAWVVAVSPAQVWLAQVITPVRLALGFTGYAQLCEVPVARYNHYTVVFGFVAESGWLGPSSSIIDSYFTRIAVTAVSLIATLCLSDYGPNATRYQESNLKRGSHDGWGG